MEREVCWLLWAALAAAMVYYLTGTTRRRSRRLPPGPTPLPVIGNVLSLRGNMHHALARLAGEHGPVMALKLGLVTAVVVSFADRSMIWLPSSDPRWKTLRGVVATHVFSPRSLAAARGVRERKSAHGLQEAVEEIILAIAKPNVSDLLPFLRPLDLQGWRRWAEKRYDKVFGILDDIINSRLADAKHAGDVDFLDSLLDLMSTGKIARDDVTTIMFDVFGAGTDTIAITVEWAMAELLRNPSIMAKARAEMNHVLADKKAIEESDMEKLPYLQAVVREVMRLHPAAPILVPHRAAEDGAEIGGHAVPKGATVIFNVWAIMRDPAAWERPEEFMPERFLDMVEEVDFRGKDYKFIPFGAGRRLCPGLPMAERVVPFILASLLHTFEWKLPGGVTAEALDVSEKFTTVNVLVTPLKAIPVLANNRHHS
uniref:Cytochrome P450 n=1 Tax=Oryza punctata TaxID=4537 RepID=A0A0E0LWP8_ORYPU